MDEPERQHEWPAQMDSVLMDVRAERMRQIGMGYPAHHDDDHSLSTWITVIRNYLPPSRAEVEPARSAMVKVAAIACAAAEALTRKMGVPSENPIIRDATALLSSIDNPDDALLVLDAAMDRIRVLRTPKAGTDDDFDLPPF